MPRAKRKRTKTAGVWLEMIKPVKRCERVIARSKLGVIVADSLPVMRQGKALFAHIPKFEKGKRFPVPYEGIFTVSELNTLIKEGYYKKVVARKEKKK